VIVNLAVFFAQHVLWPDGLGGAFDWASALIGLASAVALMRFEVSVMRVIGACALIGLARALLA
jgi:chromate transporter